MNPLQKLIAKLPPPKTDPVPFGWLKRYIFEWAIPTFFSCIGVYLIALRFIEPFATATTTATKVGATTTAANAAETATKNIEVVNTLMTSIVKSFSLSNSLSYHIFFWAIGLIAFMMTVYQYMKFKGEFPYVERRNVHVVHPITYWIFLAIIKLVTVIATPLSLVLAAAIAVQERHLQGLAIFYLVMLVIVVAPIYHLMHYNLHSPFTYTLRIIHYGSSKENVYNAELISNWLKETYDEIAKVFGSIWTNSLIINQDGKSGILSIGFPNPLNEYDSKVISEFHSVIAVQKKNWADRKFSCIDFLENAKKPKIGKKQRTTKNKIVKK